MDQLQAILHAALLEVVQGFEHLGDGQAKLATKTGTGLPAAGAARGQLDPNTDRRPDVELLGVADERLQLSELLDDQDDLLADLAGQDGHLDKLVVLETV